MSVAHIAQRAMERYGVEIDHDDVASLAQSIRSGAGVLLKIRRDGSRTYLCRLDRVGVVFKVVWNHSRVVTVAPSHERVETC